MQNYIVALNLVGTWYGELGTYSPDGPALFMSPVSPVFHTEATVSIGLKTYSEWEHPVYNIRCLCCEEERAVYS